MSMKMSKYIYNKKGLEELLQHAKMEKQFVLIPLNPDKT